MADSNAHLEINGMYCCIYRNLLIEADFFEGDC
jgi:hypothetical protein